MWKWVVGTGVVLLGLFGTGGYLLMATDAWSGLVRLVRPGEKPVEVRMEPVVRGALTRVVSAPGTVEPRTRVQISAQVAARITALPFREGDRVRKGDVVVRLDAENLAAVVESARAGLRGEEARLEGLQAELANAEAELARIRHLRETGDVSQAALDDAQAAYRRALAAVRQSQHAIEIARANIIRAQKDLDNCVITAPIDGTITRLQAEVGELVLVGTLNNPASVIMEIADLTTMVVKARVDEANIGPVQAGQPARVYINAFPDRVFAGRVELVGLKKQVDRDGTGYFETEVLIEQREGDRLRSGLTANVDIEVQTFENVLKVPSQAIVDRRLDDLPRAAVEGNTNVARGKVFTRVVYRVVDGKTVATPVTIGSSDLTHTIILGGLAEGETIVAGPYKVLASLRDGQAVVPQPAGGPAHAAASAPAPGS